MAKKDIWNDKWRQLEHLGKGGQGLTYKAENIETNDDRFVIKNSKRSKKSE
jgi:hypothetical protein